MDSLQMLRKIALEFTNNLEQLPLKLHVGTEEIRSRLSCYDFSAPRDLTQLVEEVSDILTKWTEHANHPRYFGLFLPSTDISGVAADGLAALFNPQVGSWDFSPAANEIERLTLKTIAEMMGHPLGAAHFTSGGSEANHTAVNAALTHQFPKLAQEGVRGLKGQPVLYISEEGHHSFEKIAHITGIGRRAIRQIPATDSLQLDLDALSQAVETDFRAGRLPFMVVGTAGTTNAGVIDPFDALADFCKSRNLWLHADGAWGAAAVFSPKLRPHFAGLARVDSITLDPHKWLSVPMGAGIFLSPHTQSVRKTFDVHTPYIPESGGDDRVYPYRATMQWSRRFIGLKLFMLMAHKGLDGLAGRIQHQTDLGNLLRTRLGEANSGWRILNQTPLPLVCFTRDDLTEVELKAVADQLADQQTAWISTTKLRNKTPCLRACVTNWRTTQRDIQILVEGLNREAVAVKFSAIPN